MVLAEDSKSGPDIGRGIRSGTFYGFITQWSFMFLHSAVGSRERQKDSNAKDYFVLYLLTKEAGSYKGQKSILQ